MSEQGTDSDKLFAILAYFIFFLPLLAAKDSKLAMFHANQSLILLVISIGSWFVGMLVPVLGGMVASLVGLGVFVLWILGLINASKGEMKPLPLVGNYTLLK